MTRNKEGIQDKRQKAQPPPTEPAASPPDPAFIEGVEPFAVGGTLAAQPSERFPIVGIGAFTGGLGEPQRHRIAAEETPPAAATEAPA